MNILKTLTGAVETGAGIMTGMPMLAASGASTMLGGLTQSGGSGSGSYEGSSSVGLNLSSLLGDASQNAQSVNSLGSFAQLITNAGD